MLALEKKHTEVALDLLANKADPSGVKWTSSHRQKNGRATMDITYCPFCPWLLVHSFKA